MTNLAHLLGICYSCKFLKTSKDREPNIEDENAICSITKKHPFLKRLSIISCKYYKDPSIIDNLFKWFKKWINNEI